MTEASTPDKARARTTSLRGRIPALSAAQADAMRKLFAAPVCWPLRDERMLCLAPPVSGKGMGGLFELEGDGSRLALRFDAAQAQRADVSLPWSDYAGRARLLAWSLAHEPALVRLSDAIGALRLSRIVPAFGLFGSLYLLFYTLTPKQYRKRRYPKWPGALATTLWWIAVTVSLPPAIRSFFNYDKTYGSLAGIMIALFFFYLVGLGMVIGAELNAALAETPEEAENRIGQADDRARAAAARELERMQKEGIG